MASAYMWVPFQGVSYSEALSLAASYTHNGQTGRLLTIETAEEQASLAAWLTNYHSSVWLGIRATRSTIL